MTQKDIHYCKRLLKPLKNRLTGSTYADREVECAIYVGVFKEVSQTWVAGLSQDIHPTPGICLDTRASSVVTGATNAEVHRSMDGTP